MSVAVHRRVPCGSYRDRMTTHDRRPAPTDRDTTVGLVALLTMLSFLTWGLPLSIVLWRAAL